jgi:hypothetical protein
MKIEPSSARALAAELIGDGGQQPVARGDALIAGVEHRKAPRSVGRLQHARRKARLPDRRRLLIPGHAADGQRRAQ